MELHAPTPRPWQWPTVLSLDAPLVAVLWQGLFAASFGVRLEPRHILLLAASVWLVYVADRWLDAFRLDPGRPQTTRHRFHLEKRWPLFAAWLLVLTASSVYAGLRLTLAELELGFLLLAGALVYLALVHLPFGRRRLPKEPLVALLFAAGVSLFPLARPGAILPALALPLSLFALLCFLNTALIARWEAHLDKAQGLVSVATGHPRQGTWLTLLCWLLMVLPLVLWPLWPAQRGLWLSLAGSAYGLYVLEQNAARLGADLLRVLADAALLSPALVLASGWLGP